MKKVFISGNFNILHPGHIRLFKFAKEIGAYLIVGVFCDKLIQEKNFIPEHVLNKISLITGQNKIAFNCIQLKKLPRTSSGKIDYIKLEINA